MVMSVRWEAGILRRYEVGGHAPTGRISAQGCPGVWALCALQGEVGSGIAPPDTFGLIC